MDIALAVLHFLAAAILGFAVMSIFGVQSLVAVCSSIPLAKRRSRKSPEFNLSLAMRKIVRHVLIGVLALAVISVAAIWLTDTPGTFGYLLGMILAFLAGLGRMTPNSPRNQRRFEKVFADCYEQDDEDTVDLTDL